MGQIIFAPDRFRGRPSNVVPFGPPLGTWGRLLNDDLREIAYGVLDDRLVDGDVLVRTRRGAVICGRGANFVPDDAPGGEAA